LTNITINGTTKEYTVGSVFFISGQNYPFPTGYNSSGLIGLGPNSPFTQQNTNPVTGDYKVSIGLA